MEPPAPPAPPPEARPGACPRCSAPYDVYQEYCLECGARLPAAAPVYEVRREFWSSDSPAWLWAALLALLLVALVSGAIVAVAATRDEPAARPLVSTGPGTTKPIGVITDTGAVTLPGTETETIGPLTGTTVTVPTLATTGTVVTPPPPPPPPAASGSIISWPRGKDGFTIVLSSTATSRGRGPANTKAQDAINAGLPEVGILNSDNYVSLNPGFYVVFTGVYDTLSEAQGALATARTAGFPLAYVREITP